MKLTLEQVPGLSEAQVHIRYGNLDNRLQKIIRLMQDNHTLLNVKSSSSTELIRCESVLYFESVDEKTFVYCKDTVFSSDRKLYELEELLCDGSFVRISKSCILNLDWLDSVRVLLNGKMEAKLTNGEKLIITRHYVPEFKQKLL